MNDEKPDESSDGPDIRSALVMTVLAILLGVAPWPREEVPHLVQKIGFLLEGSLTKPIDIFDLVLHGGPALLAVYTWFKYFQARFGS